MVQRFSVTLTQLTYFLVCAKSLNMTAASQELHVAQSAVSTAIAHLERLLDTTLFIRRHSKGLVLTSAGERLMRDTSHLFGFLHDTIESIQADRHEIRGSVSIACYSTLAPFLLPQLIGRLQKTHPDLNVEVIEGDYEENLSALRRGRVELAVNYDLTEAEGVQRDIVGEARPYVLVHEQHPLADRSSVALAELSDYPYVLLDLPGSSAYFQDILLQAGITPKVKYRSSSYETVRSMVATGLGYSILSQRPRIASTYTGASTVVLEISDEVPTVMIAASRLAQVHQSARAQIVAQTIREILTGPPE